MDPPPDPGARHEHACTECGTPLHEDQAACLSCGAMVDQGSGYSGIRRAALGSAAALLVLGTAVGAAVAGLPHGKHVGKAPLAQVFTPKKTIPPATADSGSGAGSDSTTKLPGSGTGSKPPAIAPETPHGTGSSGLPTTPSTGGGGSTGGAGTGSTTPTKKPAETPKHRVPSTRSHGSPLPSLYATGEPPTAATVFTTSGPSRASGADNTIDSLAKTAWTTRTNDRGIMVTPQAGDYRAIAVITETPGWTVEIWYTNADPTGGPGSGGWKQGPTQDPVGRRPKLKVPDAKHYLVWVTDTVGKRVAINEIQVFQ
jgi:hypothetical protein